MRIAFDIDDTLIPCASSFPVEAPAARWLAWLIDAERLRTGTREVMRYLRDRRCSLWIYTTSFRSPFYLRSLFLANGIRLSGVVNQDRHMRELCRHDSPYKSCTKYPPHFGIDVLIDDSEGVLMESRRYGYQVIHVTPDDRDWVTTVIGQVEPLLTSKAS